MAYPFIPAYHYSAGHNLPSSRVVVHGTVSSTVAGGARITAKYFQNPASGGSAQYVVDPAEVVQCAHDDTICWHAPPNQGSIGVEFCDWVNWRQPTSSQPYRTVADIDSFWAGKTQANFDARWSLPDWEKMLRLGAKLVHDLCVRYSIPITKISVADLLAGRRGICGHVDVSQAWRQTDHTDPGSSFPWAKFIGYVMAAAGGAVPVIPYVHPVNPLPAHPAPQPGVLSVDGGLGPATIRRWQQIMGTTIDGVISVPKSSLVVAVQNKLNSAIGASLVVDGSGIAQDNRRHLTVAALQRYLGTGADGILSSPSSSAVKALQTRLNTGRF